MKKSVKRVSGNVDALTSRVKRTDLRKAREQSHDVMRSAFLHMRDVARMSDELLRYTGNDPWGIISMTVYSAVQKKVDAIWKAIPTQKD